MPAGEIYQPSRWRRIERLLATTIRIGKLRITWLGLWQDEPHRWCPEILWRQRNTDPFGRPLDDMPIGW